MSRKQVASSVVCAALMWSGFSAKTWADVPPVYASNGQVCTILGTTGDDVLTGTTGDDVICGLEGNDTIDGLEGNDFIDGGSGNDTINGGLGDDTVDPGAGIDAVSGDEGSNTLYYATVTANLEINLAKGTAAGTNYSDVVSGIHNVIAGSGDDTIVGNETSNILHGGPGNDSLAGGAGADTLFGGPGDDKLNGGLGVDTADFSENPTRVKANLAKGVATGAGADKLSGIEKLVGVTENSQPGSTEWKLDSASRHSKSRSPLIEGYTTSPSGLPGQAIDLRVASSVSFTVTAFRMGYYNGAGARKVWKSPIELPANTNRNTVYIDSTRTLVPEWKTPILIDTNNWLPGIYLLKLKPRGKHGYGRWVPYVVRSDSTLGKVVIQPSVFTAQAYNGWGGKSLYKGSSGFVSRAYAVGIARPYFEGAGAGRLLVPYELPIVTLAESLDIPIAYETDFDVSTVPGVLDGARAFISLGHDEYWTTQKFAAVVKARNARTNLVFFGANALYWRARLSPSVIKNTKLLTVYKSAQLDPIKNSVDTTVRWRESPKAQPESKLIGQQYVCFPADATMTITNPDFFAFAHTGVTVGASFQHLAKVEVDGVSAGSRLRKGVSAYTRADVKCGKARYTSSITMYISHPGDAGVIDIGSIGWITYGFSHVATRKFVTQVSSNILTTVAQGPLGKVVSPANR